MGDGSGSHALRIVELPFDCILHILSYLSAIDIVHLLSTCRTFANNARVEAIWRNLCLPYGVDDLSRFKCPVPSFYSVYTKLLHRYGGLMGLWASDTPYKGNLLEFRLDHGSATEWGGIVGEVWKFRMPQHVEDWLDDDESDDTDVEVTHTHPNPIQALLSLPRRPHRLRVLRISFEETTDNDLEGSSPSGDVQVLCHGMLLMQPDGNHELEPHSAAVQIVVGSRQGYFLRAQGPSPHPAFPPCHPRTSVQGEQSTAKVKYTRWYDEEHAMPRIRIITMPNISQGAFEQYRGIGIYTSPTDHVAPPALMIQCSEGCRHHRPFIPFPNYSPFEPLYFPMASHVQDGIEPWRDDWHPQSLTGLWLGSYGPHGTEVLFIECVVDAQNSHPNGGTVRATKVTGDVNVPRGALTWSFDPREIQLFDTPLTGEISNFERCRCFRGVGTTSAHGYINGMQGQSVLDVAVTRSDEIKIAWIDLDLLSTYKRYKGRRAPRAHVDN